MSFDFLLSVGDEFDGYVILDFLGKGGMGEVYKAREKQLNRDVAIKIVELSPMFDEDMRTRFEREVSVLSRMNSPNVVQFYSSGERDGLVYLVQECVEGADLSALIRFTKRMSVDRVLHIAKKIAAGLSHIHRAGIIHRDMKPANVMVTHDGEVKIMDFGLVLDASATRLTVTGSVVGTLGYIPPELMEGEEYSPSVDLYQVGCIMYEALSGKMLVDDSSFLEAGFLKLRKKLASLDGLPDDVPKGLRGIIAKSLSPNAEFRYETADELLAHLKTFESKKLEEKKQQQDLAKSVTELTSEAISPVPAKRANARRLEPRQPEKGTSAKECGWLYQRAIWGGLTLLFLLFFLFWPSKIVKIEDFDCRSTPTTLQIQWFSPTTDETLCWRLEKNGDLVLDGKVQCERKRYSLTLTDRQPGDRYSFIIERPGSSPFTKIVATPTIEVVGLPIIIRKRKRPNIEFTVTFRLSHSVPTTLVLGDRKIIEAKNNEQPSFKFSFPLSSVEKSDKLLFELHSGKVTVAKGFLGLGPVTRFQTFRGDTDAKKYEKARYGDRYRLLADYMAPYRFTVNPVLANGFIYIGDRNGYVYCLNSNDFSLLWACRIADGFQKRRPRPWVLAPTKDEGLYILTTDTNLARVHRVDGRLRREKWRLAKLEMDGRALCDAKAMAHPLKETAEWSKVVTMHIDATNDVPYVPLPPGDCLLYRKQFLWRFSLYDLKVRWTIPTQVFIDNIVSLPMVGRNTAYLVGRRNKGTKLEEVLVAFDLGIGSQKWVRPLARPYRDIRPSPPTLGPKGNLYVNSGHFTICFAMDKGSETSDGGPLELWRREYAEFAIGTPCVTKNKLGLFLAEQRVNFHTDMYRLILACLDLDADGKSSPGRLRTHDLESFDFRHITFNDVLMPFEQSETINFGYGNILYGLDVEKWRLLYSSPIQGRVFCLPRENGENSIFFPTLEGYIHTLAPSVTLKSW